MLRRCLLLFAWWYLVPLAVVRAQEPSAAPAPGARPPIEYGVRFGPSFTTLTGVANFDATITTRAFEPTLNFGGFVNVPIAGALSFQPEVLFAAKGHRVHDIDAQPTTTATGEVKPPAADRVVLIRYLELPLLLRASKRAGEHTSLYLIGGPALAFKRGAAVIRSVADSGVADEIDDLVKGKNFSYVIGGGVQHKRWLVDGRLTRGLQDIAVNPLPAPVKANALSVLIGVRF